MIRPNVFLGTLTSPLLVTNRTHKHSGSAETAYK
jgi:hypothetical protein